MFNKSIHDTSIVDQFNITIKLDNEGTYWMTAFTAKDIEGAKAFMAQVKEKLQNV